MDVVAADVSDHKSDVCPRTEPQQSQPEGDLTSGNGVVDEGPGESLLPLTSLAPVGQVYDTGSPGTASSEEPPVGVDRSYEVMWTVDIAVAVPRDEDEVRDGRAKKRAEAMGEPPPRAQSYYHLEYRLLPEHTEPVKVDLAVFGPIVRMYKDNESKTLRPWCEGDRMWVSWSHAFRVCVTRELLEDLLSYRIHFRIWEGKGTVCSKARNDRPRALRPAPAQPEDGAHVCGVVRDTVFWLREQTELGRSKKKLRKTTAETQRPSVEQTQEAGTSFRPQEQRKNPIIRMPDFSAIQNTTKNTTTALNQSNPNNNNLGASHQSGPQKSEMTVADLRKVKKTTVAWAKCSPLCLLAGATSLAESFSVARPSTVCEALVHISLDRALMSEQLRTQLNPLVITILSANAMPSTPVPFQVLQEECLPVYCQYQFHDSKLHRTKAQRHGPHVHFNDILVVLAGSMGGGELREFLTGPPLEIQVHDRDRKPAAAPTPPGLFGTRPGDVRLSSVALVGGKRTAHHPAAAAQVYQSYGVAHLDLSELALGRRSLKASLPIRSCPPPQLLGRDRPMWERKMMDLPGDADGHGTKPVEQGHYFDSNAHLKVKVEIAHPLLGSADPALGSGEDLMFGRAVFIIGSSNVSVLTRLRAEILKINATAFNMGSCSLALLDRALSNHLLRPEERESKDLNYVTGFHVQDENLHLVVVEGLRHGAVKFLWENIPQKRGGLSEEQVKVLYTSALGFSKRIYGALDLNLSPVHLHQPLEDIMRNPLVYVRDMLPHSTFQALSRLSQLRQAGRLLQAVRCDLFPTDHMILSLSRDLGTLPRTTELRSPAAAAKEEEVEEEPAVSSPLAAWERRREPLDMHNTEYMEWKRLAAKQRGSKQTRDYVKENISEIQARNVPEQKPSRAVFRPEPAVDGPVHNYSTQTFNSHRQGMELLRKEMAKVPDCRFTYSQQYQSATLEPGGFTRAPRIPSTPFDCYLPREHPPGPDQSRVEELNKPWKENILHANTLRPTLTRERWPWGRRWLDFQLYTQPPHFFGPPPPVSVHLVGEFPQPEQHLEGGRQKGRGPHEVLPPRGSVPDNNSQLPNFKCHLGVGSWKFQDILKDEPRKYSLRKPGLALTPLPALAVLSGGEDEDHEEQYKALGPGPFPGKNFSAINNVIPRRHSQYKRYRFMRYCVPHTMLHKRRSSPLSESERVHHVAQSPHVETQRQNTPPARPFKNLVEVRTHGALTLYAQ